MTEIADVNWLAIAVGTVLSFLIGWAWYSPKLFGKKWAEGSGVSLDSANKMPVFAMISQFVALFFLALVIGITATNNALFTAIFAILAIATFIASTGGFIKKSTYAIVVDFIYILVVGISMIIVQGIFLGERLTRCQLGWQKDDCALSITFCSADRTLVAGDILLSRKIRAGSISLDHNFQS